MNNTIDTNALDSFSPFAASGQQIIASTKDELGLHFANSNSEGARDVLGQSSPHDSTLSTSGKKGYNSSSHPRITKRLETKGNETALPVNSNGQNRLRCPNLV